MKYVCPACGYGEVAEDPLPPYIESVRVTCPCCGIRFGYDDLYGTHAGNRKRKYQRWRDRWVAGGMQWNGPEPAGPPPGWDPAAQLRRAEQFAVPHYDCPVCGYDGLPRPPYYPDAWGSPSWDICPCCGPEFGYQDASGYDAARRSARHVQLREQWIAGGMRWHSTMPEEWYVNVAFGGTPPEGWEYRDELPPESWDPKAQLERLVERLEAADDETDGYK